MRPQKTIYHLSKYSRAIVRQPEATLAQSSQLVKDDLDWHHHTTQNLRLLLETSRNPDGSLASARLRVVWPAVENGGHVTDGRAAQDNMVFVSVPAVRTAELISRRTCVHRKMLIFCPSVDTGTPFQRKEYR